MGSSFGKIASHMPGRNVWGHGANPMGDGGTAMALRYTNNAVNEANMPRRGPIQGPWAGSVPTFANAAAGYLPPGGAVPTAQHPYLGAMPTMPVAAPKVAPQPVMGGPSLGSAF